MIVKPVNDRALIESVLFHPVIFDSISEDGAQKHIPQGHYLGGFVDGVCVGVIMVNPISKRVADVHIQVLPEYRKSYAVAFGVSARDWLFDAGFEKLVSQVPFCNTAVKNFSRKIGFEVEGVCRHRWFKHGKVWDSWYIGCVRGEQWAE